MRRPSRKGLSLVFVLCAQIPLTAQDLHSIGREKPLSFAGGISVNQILYSSRGIASRREPYSYFASGSLNISFYGLSIPLSFNVSNRSAVFSQPFNQYSLHPSWKWISLHAGYTSLTFSPYTVNGHIFRGAAIELEPKGNWKVSALCGRFLKAVEADTSGSVPSLPAFERNGYALKATYGNGRNAIGLTVFRAMDEKQSITPPPDSLGITPQENLAASIAGAKTLFKHIVLKAELAASAITRDARAKKARHDHLLSTTGVLFQPKLSTSYYQAFKTSFDYQHGGWLAGVAYERVDPGYRTLGAYYFNNDLENITLNLSGGILKGKMNVAASTGVQRDNLDNMKVSSMRRMVGSLHLQYAPSERMNVATSYSGFQTYTHLRSPFETINQLTPYDHVDTLTFTQISANATLSGMFTVSHKEKERKNINLNFSWQRAADQQGRVQQHAATSFYNLNAGYAISMIPKNMTVSVAVHATMNEGAAIHTRMLGPNASLSRSFLSRKLRTSLSCSWNHTYTNGKKMNTMLNARLQGVLTIHQKHNFNISAVMVNRTTGRASPQMSITEFTGTIGYSFTFSHASRGKKST